MGPSPQAVWRGLFWICAVCGVVVSLWPHPQAQAPWFPLADKVQHAAAFAVLVVLGTLGRFRSQARLFLGVVALGAAIEVMQSFTATRTAEWGDLAADVIGALIGLALSRAFTRRSGGLPEEHGR